MHRSTPNSTAARRRAHGCAGGHQLQVQPLLAAAAPSPPTPCTWSCALLCSAARLHARTQSTTRVKPFICTMPMRLDDGWNQIQFNLADFTRRAYGA
jgi:hypothetical protein